LNPQFVKERMKGDATTAQSFAKTFQNIFGWSATRPTALTENIYDDLYDMYIMDVNNLGIAAYFDRVNPTALREMTETMLESARKGFWKPTEEQLRNISALKSSTQRYEDLIMNEMAEKGESSTNGDVDSADADIDAIGIDGTVVWQKIIAVAILILVILLVWYCIRTKKNH
ncbi:MAG: cobaltochelatase subunit CobN, partial [Duncaniella sp.]|nr:cobaltochelatase subunit CobN [Duncaniella sp.]